MENREAVSLEFEFQQHKNKSKSREIELLDALEDKQKEIKRLEQSLQTVTNEVLNSSKEELRQISKDVDDAETVCVKCKDLNQLLTNNKQLTQKFEKVELDCQALQKHLDKISSEFESEKLRAESLEVENQGLKKNAEHMQTLHGTFEELQTQISYLQAEKCKLESVKIEFEVMSKETANKIAEKISISQEIQALNTQKETLSTECDKLLAAINANASVTDELNRLRTENDSLHSELQTIRAKLETAQSDYAHLLTENQSKSDNYEKLNMEVLSARNQLQTLQGEYNDIQQKYEHLQAECNKHEDTIGEIQSEYDSIQIKYQGLQREYEKLENDSVQSIADCDRVQNQNENLETEIRELKTKVEEAQRKLLENDSLQLELESLKSEMNRLQGEYDKSLALKRKSASPVKEQNDIDLRHENNRLKHDLEKLQVQFNEMQKEYDDISTQLVDNFSDYETLQAEVAKLEEELKKYTDSAHGNRLESEDFKALKVKTEQLQTENSNLAKENAEWKKTISTDSMRGKCDETEQLCVQLEEAKNLSALSESPRKSAASCEQFIELADSLLEIEIPIADGRSRLFQAAQTHNSTMGSKMSIDCVNGITQGPLNEYRGTIEFVIEHKSENEIYDSLEAEDNVKSANSCDSLDDAGQQLNELIEEKSQHFEKIRDLEESIAKLKIQNGQLESLRKNAEQLSVEKVHLLTICDENKCKINELNEIISRAECEKYKLIIDCEQLKKTVESESSGEGASREIYEELKRRNEEMYEKLNKFEEYEEKCAELKEQLLALQSKLGDEESVKECNTEDACKCIQYRDEISKLEAMVGVLSEQLKIKDDLPTRPEVEETINQLRDQLQACKCMELQTSLGEKARELAELTDDMTLKYEQDISALLEKLKQQECKCQKAEIEIIELKTSLEEKTQEAAEGAVKFENLAGNHAKLQAEYDVLERQIVCERKKAADLGNTLVILKGMEEECTILQNSVACLSQTVASLGNERNAFMSQKESLEKQCDTLNEKLLILEQESRSLKAPNQEVRELGDKLKTVVEEKRLLLEEYQTLKNSKISLHEQLEKLIEDHKLNLKDKERLETECHKSSNEIEKLKVECESNLREKSEMKQKCDQLKEDLNKVSAEKKTLAAELGDAKEQHEKLKESNKEDRRVLEAKCSSLGSKIGLLSSAKKELQLALDKAKKHSEFLLTQGKDLEEQLTLELSTVRSSNNSMAQQIDDLYEKLEKAKDDLKLAQESAEKDEVIILLTNTNNLLSTKSSELAANLALLKEELEQSNNSKHAFEEKITNKDKLIGQLSAESSELEKKLLVLKQELVDSNNEKNKLITKGADLKNEVSLLKQTLKESERCLSHEVHLKEVLEKAKIERDDLIVKLTNNNNTLVTKIKGLEEKLAILGNQFEESKRHLSGEVARLKQLLMESSQVTKTQKAKIEDLTNKIQTLEDDIKTARGAAAERDTLLQKLDETQAKYNTLALEHASLENRRSSYEADFNSAKDVAVENTALTQKINEMQSTLQEVQLKCKSLSLYNEKLESTNKLLAKQLDESIKDAHKCKTLNDEIAKLQGQHEKHKIDSVEWQSKESHFVEQISKLQGNIGSLVSEKQTIQARLEIAKNLSLSKISNLEQQIHLLQKEQSINLSKSISPKKEKAIHHLLGENHQLKVKNMNLMEKLDSCQKSQNEERKNRRLSTHDERRRQSFWDSNRDVSTMTEPTSSECNCSELDRKLNELKQKLLIRDSQVNTLSMELKNHPLKMENATLKKLLNEEESKQQKLRQDIKKCQQLIVSKTNEIRHCAKCSEASKRIFVDRSTQTVDRDESECYRKLLSKYEDLKMICRVRHNKIKELEDALSTGKENANENSSSHPSQQYKKYELLKKELKVIQEKYWEAKTLCNLRFEQIKDLNNQLSKKS